MSKHIKQELAVWNLPPPPLMSLIALLTENSLGFSITRFHQLVIELSYTTEVTPSQRIVQRGVRHLLECSQRLKELESRSTNLQKKRKHSNQGYQPASRPLPIHIPRRPHIQPSPASTNARRPVYPLGRIGPFEIFQETNFPYSVVIRVPHQASSTTRCQFSVYMPQLGRTITFVVFYPSLARCIVSIKPRLPGYTVTPQEFVVNPQRRYPPPPPPPSSSY